MKCLFRLYKLSLLLVSLLAAALGAERHERIDLRNLCSIILSLRKLYPLTTDIAPEWRRRKQVEDIAMRNLPQRAHISNPKISPVSTERD